MHNSSLLIDASRSANLPTRIGVRFVEHVIVLFAAFVGASVFAGAVFAQAPCCERITIVGTKWVDQSATLCDQSGNCVYDNRVPGPGGSTDGGVAGVDLGSLKNIISAIDLPCKPSGMSEADYIKGAVAMCVAKAAAAYSAAFGVTIGGFSMIVTQSQCNTKVQVSLGDGSAACKTA